MFEVILFYKYVVVPDVEALRDFVDALCTRLQLNGKVRLASEGINSTVAGTKDAIEEFKAGK